MEIIDHAVKNVPISFDTLIQSNLQKVHLERGTLAFSEPNLAKCYVQKLFDLFVYYRQALISAFTLKNQYECFSTRRTCIPSEFQSVFS